MTYDAFICHASEDKESFVRPLAESLIEAGLRIWYDEFSLKVGDSLRQTIERGLRESNFGIVVFSEAFFAKKWPQAELDGLFEKETIGRKIILPVWHNITYEHVLAVSPIFAGRVAAKSNAGLDNVVDMLIDVINPDAAHKTISGKTLFASPTEIVLHHGRWAVSTPVMVTNRGSKPAHSVWLKIALNGKGITAQSVLVESNSRSTSLKGQVGDITVSGDQFRMNAVDSRGNEAVFLIFHTIAPGAHVEVIVSGSIAMPSKAAIELAAFSNTPAVSLKGAEGISFPFTPPESLNMKNISLLMRRS